MCSLNGWRVRRGVGDSRWHKTLPFSLVQARAKCILDVFRCDVSRYDDGFQAIFMKKFNVHRVFDDKRTMDAERIHHTYCIYKAAIWATYVAGNQCGCRFSSSRSRVHTWRLCMGGSRITIGILRRKGT